MEESVTKIIDSSTSLEANSWSNKEQSIISKLREAGDSLISNNQNDKQQPATSIFTSDLIFRYVNLNLVRKMIAQNLVEFLFICVIITYLIYYFNQISRRPRLIGNNRSKFVEFIKKNLNDTLGHRFSPLIYFWGTNPQTALFGYLQGQTSTDEMPRTKFRRQYLYVSDAQYLTSNVDLSEHYSETRHLVQLKVNESTMQQVASLLNQNIRLALDETHHKKNNRHDSMVNGNHQNKNHNTNQSINHTTHDKQVFANHEPSSENIVGTLTDERLKRIKEHDLSSSGSSSSDSGVFAGHSSTSSLSSSLAADEAIVSIAMDKCSCKTRYDTEPPQQRLELLFDNAIMSNDHKSQSSSDKNTTTNSTAMDTSLLVREQLQFGQCALDWYKSSHEQYHKNKLVALISAGMTTGSDKKYVTDTVSTLEQLGYEVCVFIRRGVGGLKLSSTKFFSPAKWRDFETAVLSVRQQRPGAHLVAVGFSFGSIELCRYLSMSGQRSLVDAALLISCPFDPEAGGRNMRKRVLNRRIDAYLAKNLGKQLYQAMGMGSTTTTNTVAEQQQQCALNESAISNHNGSMVNLATLPKIKSLVDFEDNYNRVLQNYPNSEAYAADSRLQDHLSFIETPTLCLSSEDDFMAPLKLLPLDQIRANKNLCMVLTRRGGHMAFIDGLFWPKRPYFAQRIIAKYMEAVRLSLLGDNIGAQDLACQFNNNFHSNSHDKNQNKSHYLMPQMFDAK